MKIWITKDKSMDYDIKKKKMDDSLTYKNYFGNYKALHATISYIKDLATES